MSWLRIWHIWLIACRIGVQDIYLSAIPPIPAFYAKLGYEVCNPVSIYGGPVPNPSPRESPVTVEESSPPPSTQPPAPPPSPPPLMISFMPYSMFNKVPKVYMRKSLYEIESWYLVHFLRRVILLVKVAFNPSCQSVMPQENSITLSNNHIFIYFYMIFLCYSCCKAWMVCVLFYLLSIIYFIYYTT